MCACKYICVYDVCISTLTYTILTVYTLYIYLEMYTHPIKRVNMQYTYNLVYIYIYTEYISTCYYNYIITNLMLAPLARVAK